MPQTTIRPTFQHSNLGLAYGKTERPFLLQEPPSDSSKGPNDRGFLESLQRQASSINTQETYAEGLYEAPARSPSPALHPQVNANVLDRGLKGSHALIKSLESVGSLDTGTPQEFLRGSSLAHVGAPHRDSSGLTICGMVGS